MTNKEIIEILKGENNLACFDPNTGEEIIPIGFNADCVEAHTEAIKIIENFEKYKWHDLSKNPDDLPDDYTMVIIQNVTHHQFFAYISNEQWFVDGEGLFSLADINDGHIIAWRDFDYFEGDKE